MDFDMISTKRDMQSYVEAAMAISRDSSQSKEPSTIMGSISFSSLLDNAIKVELLKGRTQSV